jgi:LGFP repeat-containing protein
MTAHGPRLLAALVAALTLAPPAVAAGPRRGRSAAPEKLGEGWQSVAWKVDHRVIKFGKPRIPQGDIMPFADPELRDALLDSGVELYQRLRDSPDFAAYLHVLVSTRRKGAHLVEQDLAEGLRYDELSDAAKRIADADADRLLAAARRAAPEGDFDLNHGNLTYFEDGRIRALFDPAGTYHFAKAWKARQPGAAAATELVEAQLRAKGFRKASDRQLFRIGRGYGRRVEGGTLAWGEGLLVANPDRGEVYLVAYGFRNLYESEAPRALSGRKEKVGELLGLPLENEQPRGKGTIQHFERGYLLWDPDSEEGISVHVDAAERRARARRTD